MKKVELDICNIFFGVGKKKKKKKLKKFRFFSATALCTRLYCTVYRVAIVVVVTVL